MMVCNVRFPGVWLLLSAYLALAQSQTQKQLCELYFTGCPDAFEIGKVGPVQIPDDIVALSASIKYCSPDIEILDSLVDPPSIMLIIDHSGSMAGTDPKRARFTVASEILQEIYTKHPSTQVGLVVFANRLAFDVRDKNEDFRKITGSPWSDAYIPLTALNDERKGIRVLQRYLQLRPVGNGAFEKDSALLTYASRQPAQRTPTNEKQIADPFGIRYGTDISLGFEAAKDALAQSTATKENQFIIFLSDGDAAHIDKERAGQTKAFIQGANVPTTFTIYFGKAHPDLVTMTNNIKANGYSGNNDRSNLWSISTPHSELLELLRREVLTKIFSTKTWATRASIQSVTVNDIAQAVTDTAFLFSKLMPLDATRDTIRMKFDYSYRDTVRGKSDVKDTSVSTTIVLERKPGAELPSGMSERCWTYTLGLYYAGKPVTSVTETMRDLEVRFSVQGDRAISVDGVRVASTVSGDSLLLALSRDSSYYSGRFTRETSTPLADTKLQNARSDFITVVWRNRDIPLDTIGIRVPYVFCRPERPAPNVPAAQNLPPGNMSIPYEHVYALKSDVTLIKSAPGDTIWYTLDGTQPQAGNPGQRYIAGRVLTIDKDTVLLAAIATREGCAASDTLRVMYRRDYVRIAVVSAEYVDMNDDGSADGLVDYFIVKVDPLSGTPDIAAINKNKNLLVLPQGLVVDSVSAGPLPSSIRIRVRKHSTYLSGVQRVTVRESGGMKTDGLLAQDTISAADKVAPVIMSAEYRTQNGHRTGTQDTLQVQLSDAAVLIKGNTAQASVFKVYSPSGATTYTLQVTLIKQVDQTTLLFLVNAITGGPPFPGDNDSIWLEVGCVQDVAGNTQNNGLNIRRRLSVKFPRLTIEVATAPNPFAPGQTTLPSTLLDAEYRFGGSGASSLSTRTRGTAIEVTVFGGMDEATSKLLVKEVRCNILDAVGNVVEENMAVYQKGGKYYIPWNGANRSGRLVGSGTYLADVSVTTVKGETDVERIKIGIRRK